MHITFINIFIYIYIIKSNQWRSWMERQSSKWEGCDRVPLWTSNFHFVILAFFACLTAPLIQYWD